MSHGFFTASVSVLFYSICSYRKASLLTSELSASKMLFGSYIIFYL